MNLRPHGPEPCGGETQATESQEVVTDQPTACTAACEKHDASALAGAILNLSPEERARLEERINQVRHLLETLDLVYDTFAALRASDAWPKELARMQRWLRRDAE